MVFYSADKKNQTSFFNLQPGDHHFLFAATQTLLAMLFGRVFRNFQKKWLLSIDIINNCDNKHLFHLVETNLVANKFVFER